MDSLSQPPLPRAAEQQSRDSDSWNKHLQTVTEAWSATELYPKCHHHWQVPAGTRRQPGQWEMPTSHGKSVRRGACSGSSHTLPRGTICLHWIQKGWQKRLSLPSLFCIFFFSLLSVFLSPSHAPEDCWMQGSEPLCAQPLLRASLALSQPKGASFLQGAVSGLPTLQPEQLCDGACSVWVPLPRSKNGQICHNVLWYIFIITNINKKWLPWAHAADLLPSGSGWAPSLLPVAFSRRWHLPVACKQQGLGGILGALGCSGSGFVHPLTQGPCVAVSTLQPWTHA